MTQSESAVRDFSRQSTITEFGRELWRDTLTAAIFLDRDGVIIEDRHYQSDPGEIQFLPGALEALRLLKTSFRLIIITNQSGIARGLFTEDELISFHQQLQELMNGRQVSIDAIYYCPHHPTLGRREYLRTCSCRKPEPGLIQQARRDFSLQLENSFLVGDKESDVLAGKKAGVYTFLLKQGTIGLTSSSVADDQADSWTEILQKILSNLPNQM